MAIDTNKLRSVPVSSPLPEFTPAGTMPPAGFEIAKGLAAALTIWARRHRMAKKGLVAMPQTFFVLQGGAGTGKTTHSMFALTTSGNNVLSFPASDLTNPNEGENVIVLRKAYADCARIESVTKRPTILKIEDPDIVLSTDETVQKTINRPAIEAELQARADAGGNATVLTGNDFSRCRHSLFRPQRALMFTHVPTLDEVARAATVLLGITTAAEGRVVGAAVAALPEQPIAFWHDVARRIEDDRMLALMDRHADDEDLAAALAQHRELDAETLEVAIEASLAATARNFLDTTTAKE